MSISTHGAEWHEQFLFVFFVSEIILFTPTVFGNSLLIYCIKVNRSLHTRSFILMANLAVADLLCGLVFMPFDMSTYIFPDLRGHKLLCLLRNSLSIWSVGASILNLLLMSIDRFLAIFKPLLHMKMSKTYMTVLIGASWLSSATIAYLPLMGWNSWNETNKCIHKWFAPIPEGYNLLVSLVYVTSLTLSFVLIISVVKQSLVIVNKKENDVQRIPAARVVSALDKAKLFAVILVLFVVCWVPYSVLAVLENSVFPGNISVSIAKRYSSILSLSNASINWIVYGLKNKRINHAFSRVLCRCRRKVETDTSLSFNSIKTITKSSSFILGGE